MATMKDVARLAAVSTATVSAALSGAAFVSPALKERVMAAVEELGYAPNAMASGLKRGRSRLIGLIVPDITNPFFTEFVRGVQRRAVTAGFTVLLGVSDDSAAQEAELVRLMRSHQAAGTIIAPCGSEEDCLRFTTSAGAMPVVVVDNAPLGLDHDSVVLDNRRAAGIATAHILSFGHRDIAIVAGPAHRFVSRERMLGFEAAMEAASLSVPERLVSRGDFHMDEARAAAMGLLGREPRPSAVFVTNNQMLIGLMQAAAALGLDVPRRLSVVSIDDFPWAQAFVPALTTVRQPIDDMAAAALGLLTSRLANGAAPTRRVVLQPELVTRASCIAFGPAPVAAAG